MQQSILTKIKLFILRNRQNRIFRKFVQVLCCMVVFVTTYALILPAITMEQDAFCGKEAHEHTEECLQPVPVPVLVCTQESLGIHTHSGSCYNADGAVICGQADYVVHSHSGSCYDAAGQLVCLLPERSSHVHGESCYIPGETQPEILHVHSEACYIQEQGELTCTEEEREGHSHDDQCYGPGELLECSLTENHVHDASCYSLPLTCSLSTEPHVHSDACYGTGNLQCTTPEYHTHTDSCWDRTLSCGKSEGGHQHSGSCWETVQVCQNTEETHEHGEGCTESRLICGLTEESHYHGESCYTANLRCQIPENHAHSSSCYESILVCGKEAGQAHEHNDSCYGTEPQLQCRMPENHVHDSGCYNRILNCEVPEDPGHRHEDACYQWNSVLNCGLEEGQPEPTEPPEPVLACTEPEAPVHVHGDSCFELQEKTCQGGEDHQHTDSCYTCGLEAHAHTLICYSDPDADVESPEVWKATFAHVTLTGDWPTDVVAIAETQLGYTESTRNYDVWEDNSIHGYTRYGAWYGVPHGDWCGMFASFCLEYAGVEGMPYNYGVRPWIEDLTKLGLYYTAKETKAQKGNLIFFDWDADGLSDHVGIVAEVQDAQEHSGASVKTIEGNSGNAVRYQHYDPNDPVILGYGLLPGQERIPIETEEESSVYYCGLEEHIHEDACYDAEGMLLCELTEHSHTDTCLEKPVVYGCGLEEHTHTESCYDSDGQLICDLEEHIHEDSCIVNATEVFIESSTESVVVTYSAILVEEAFQESAPMMFRMYAASPMTVSEAEISAQTTSTDLKEYVEQYKEQGSKIELLILTMGNTVPENNQIEIGKQYQLSLYFAVPGHGMKAGTYVYKLPEAFNYTTQTGKLYDSTKSVLLGEWTLHENGDLVFVFNEASNSYQDVAMTATIRTTVKENVEQVDFDGNIFVVISPTDSQRVPTQVTKFGTGMVLQDGNWVENRANFTRIKWTSLFTPGTDGLMPGTYVKDTLTSDLHYFSDEDKAAGITIGFNDGGGEWHLITVPAESITWAGDNGFEFTLPDVNCQFCGNKFQFHEGRQYHLTYYTTVKDNLKDGYYLHQNDIIVDGQIVSGSLGLQIGTPDAAIVKSGYLDATSNNYVWNIRATVPAYNNNQAFYWKILEFDRIALPESNWIPVKDVSIQQNMITSFTAEVNGVTYNVPDVTKVTPNDRYCYRIENDYIYLASKCECSVGKCATNSDTTDSWWCNTWYWYQPEDKRDTLFCSCWTENNDVVFNIELVYNGDDIISEHGGDGLRFYNTAVLEAYYDTTPGKWNEGVKTDSSADVAIPGMFNKLVLEPGPNSNNQYTASFEITVNDSKTDLSQLGGEGTATDITIVDEMSNSLYYVRGTMVITQVDVYDHRTVLQYGTDYNMTVNGHTISIDIHNPGPYQYILNYDAQLIADITAGNPSYENHASVHIGAKTYHASTQESYVTDYTYTAHTYSVTMLKTSAESNQPLPGAVFGLFAESGLEIARGSTDADGKLTFETDLQKNIVFRMHMPYYLQEISAPAGYILDTTKHWFYFCNHENPNGSREPCAECIRLNGTYDGIVEIGQTNEEHDRYVDVNVTNTMGGYELPATGGTGNELYTVGGMLLILAAVILLYNQKKCRKEDIYSS